jgi:N-acyl homoserine lactone hydrolase
MKNYANVSTVVKVKGKDVKVHGFSTGSVALKQNFLKKKGIGVFAKINMVLDKHFSEFCPIWVWVIEHPDGLVVIDTGEISDITNLDVHLSKESWFKREPFKHVAKFKVSPEDELNNKFDSLRLNVNDVSLLVLTHLHIDHTDGLKFFPKKTEIIVGEYESKHPTGDFKSSYPAWFKPNAVPYKKDRIEVFDKAYPINQSEDLFYVPTPGHTMGHSSIVFKTDHFDILFAGDTSYFQSQVLENEIPGVNANYKKTHETYEKIKAYAKIRPTIYLPSHDPEAGQRLLEAKWLL